jgi:hypothetical protein
VKLVYFRNVAIVIKFVSSPTELAMIEGFKEARVRGFKGT